MRVHKSFGIVDAGRSGLLHLVHQGAPLGVRLAYRVLDAGPGPKAQVWWNGATISRLIAEASPE